jgi:hypothetical protein
MYTGFGDNFLRKASLAQVKTALGVPDVSALSNKTSTINSVGVLPSGQTYCKIAEWQDGGGAWASTSLLCEIQGANDVNEREPTRIYCRVERGGTANANLNVNTFAVNGYSNIQCYVQKEADNYVRWYVSNYTNNTSCYITYYNQYDASCTPAIAGMASLPNAGGSNGALARATGAKIRAVEAFGTASQVIQGDGTLRNKTGSAASLAADIFASNIPNTASKNVALIGDNFAINGYQRIEGFQRQMMTGLFGGSFDNGSGSDNNQYPSGDLNALTSTSFIAWVNATANSPYNGWGTLINVRHRAGVGDGNNYGDQIWVGSQNTGNAGRMWTRSQNGGAWTAWVEKANKSDIPDISGKVSKSGDTMTGPLTLDKLRPANDSYLYIGDNNNNGNLVLNGNLEVIDSKGNRNVVVENDDFSWNGRIHKPTRNTALLGSYANGDVFGMDISTGVLCASGSATNSSHEMKWISSQGGIIITSSVAYPNQELNYAYKFVTWKFNRANQTLNIAYEPHDLRFTIVRLQYTGTTDTTHFRPKLTFNGSQVTEVNEDFNYPYNTKQTLVIYGNGNDSMAIT